jgi:hypothetical protein
MKQTPIVLLAALISMAATSGAAAMNQPPGSVFSDCPACSEMVVVAAGSFTMGQCSGHAAGIMIGSVFQCPLENG